MAGNEQKVRVWLFHSAPLEFRKLFPDAQATDWLTHVPQRERYLAEASLFRWRSIYPVRGVELPDGSAVYWGSENEAMASLPKLGLRLTAAVPGGEERRAAVRVQIECPSRYETKSEPRLVGAGHTIDMSSSGISFTTQTALPKNIELTLQVAWPVALEGNVPVELRAVGTVARTEPMKAAVRMERLSFSISV